MRWRTVPLTGMRRGHGAWLVHPVPELLKVEPPGCISGRATYGSAMALFVGRPNCFICYASMGAVRRHLGVSYTLPNDGESQPICCEKVSSVLFAM